ncbi:MAG: hypothetical protein CVU71_17140 [Deltaproteobacteria bacterium HGW-Deltaproteobacteria-6]|jgi:hypothetical protein|nr:MAG: hypothetical protein CVU71_17140 [Deltaproteobacteria bacterium HGW-Deltaproteobacteria-6]
MILTKVMVASQKDRKEKKQYQKIIYFFPDSQVAVSYSVNINALIISISKTGSINNGYIWGGDW